MSENNKDYDILPGGPTITPEMINLVHKTLETHGLIYYSEGKIYIPTEKGWRLLTEIKPVKEEINAYGSQEIIATSNSCIGITRLEKIENLKEKECIIGVKSDKSCKELNNEFKNALKGGSRLRVTIEADGINDELLAYGSPALKLSSQEDIIIRKDDFIDGRTLAILCNKSANDLKKELIEKLKNPETKVKIILEILP
jgi:hypothetical protein